MPTLPASISPAAARCSSRPGATPPPPSRWPRCARCREFGDSLVLVVPSDHEISTDAAVLAERRGRRCGGAGRPAGGVRHQADAARDRLRLYRGRRRAAAASSTSRASSKSPTSRPRRAISQAGNFFWNTGIFLFRAGAMRDAFAAFQPDIWQATEAAYKAATSAICPASICRSTSMRPSRRPRSTTPSWSGPRTSPWCRPASAGTISAPGSRCSTSARPTSNGNVIVGDVVAIDCENSYIRSDGRLLSAIGLKDVAIVSTPDATFVAPVSHSQNVKKIVEQLEKSGRLETRFTPAHDRVIESGAWRRRVHHWLFEETLPLWSTAGVDERHGGFHEALGFDGTPLMKPKRMRTMARQVYAFAVAKARGWDGPADRLIAHGIDFMAGNGRTDSGGWVRTLNVDGSRRRSPPRMPTTIPACCWRWRMRICAAIRMRLRLGEETFAFLDAHLEDRRMTGFLETSDGEGERRSNPHMHLLEAFLAWHQATGDRTYLRRAARIIDLFRSHFFDPESWTLGEYFDDEWKPAAGEKGAWTEPGHHFEWASLLVDFAGTQRPERADRLCPKTLCLGHRQRPQPRHRPCLWRGVAAGPAARPGVAQLAAGRSDQGGDRARRHRRARPQAGDRGARRPAVPLAHRPGAARPVDRPHRRARPLAGDRSAGEHLLSPGLRADAVSGRDGERR